MLKIILQSTHPVVPFNEPARDLRIQNKPLWLAQRDALAPFATREMELPPNGRLPQTREARISQACIFLGMTPNGGISPRL